MRSQAMDGQLRWSDHLARQGNGNGNEKCVISPSTSEVRLMGSGQAELGLVCVLAHILNDDIRYLIDYTFTPLRCLSSSVRQLNMISAK